MLKIIENFQNILCETIKNSVVFSITVDRCIDIISTCQLAIFIFGIHDSMDVTEELAIVFLSGITIGNDLSLFSKVVRILIQIVTYFSFKLVSVTIHGALVLIGLNVCFIMNIQMKKEMCNDKLKLFNCIIN